MFCFVTLSRIVGTRLVLCTVGNCGRWWSGWIGQRSTRRTSQWNSLAYVVFPAKDPTLRSVAGLHCCESGGMPGELQTCLVMADGSGGGEREVCVDGRSCVFWWIIFFDTHLNSSSFRRNAPRIDRFHMQPLPLSSKGGSGTLNLSELLQFKR